MNELVIESIDDVDDDVDDELDDDLYAAFASLTQARALQALSHAVRTSALRPPSALGIHHDFVIMTDRNRGEVWRHHPGC